MESQLLALNGLEVVHLTDSISNKDIAEGLPDKEAYVPLARSLLLKLGSAYCELVSKDGFLPGPIDVAITEEEAWLLRSKVRTGDLAIDGKTIIGISLLLKIYAILINFHAELDLLPDSDMADSMLTESNRQYLRGLIDKEKEDARRATDKDPSGDAYDYTGS